MVFVVASVVRLKWVKTVERNYLWGRDGRNDRFRLGELPTLADKRLSGIERCVKL